MIQITKEIIRRCAANLMFELTQEEIDTIYCEFQSVMKQITFLSSIPGVDEAEPMTFPYRDHQKLMREDKPCRPLKAEDAIGNSKSTLGDQIKLPRVVGNQNDQVE